MNFFTFSKNSSWEGGLSCMEGTECGANQQTRWRLTLGMCTLFLTVYEEIYVTVSIYVRAVVEFGKT